MSDARIIHFTATSTRPLCVVGRSNVNGQTIQEPSYVIADGRKKDRTEFTRSSTYHTYMDSYCCSFYVRTAVPGTMPGRYLIRTDYYVSSTANTCSRTYIINCPFVFRRPLTSNSGICSLLQRAEFLMCIRRQVRMSGSCCCSAANHTTLPPSVTNNIDSRIARI